MSRPYEGPGTWYRLIRASLEENGARTVLTPIQAKSLMARLKAEHMFPTPAPDDSDPAGSPRLSGRQKKFNGIKPSPMFPFLYQQKVDSGVFSQQGGECADQGSGDGS